MKRRSFCAMLPGIAAAATDAAFPARDGWKPLFTGNSLAGWHPQDGRRPNSWRSASSVTVDPTGIKLLTASSAPGPILLNAPAGKAANLVSNATFGDLELSLEFMVPTGSNSGVYLHGLYEIQIFDSFGVADPKTSDCGAIYHRWIAEHPVGGSAPKSNASRAPGEWQDFHVWFRAPRFDASGKKIENARFLRVLQNGTPVQENVPLEGGTRSHMPIPEAPANPIMLQGDHGPVAFRNLYVRPLRPSRAR